MKVSDEEVSWATPEAKALLKSVEEFGPIYDDAFPVGRPWNAYLASLKPKTVTLPDRYVVDDGHSVWVFATRDAAWAWARTQGGYVRVLPAETRDYAPRDEGREIKAQDERFQVWRD